MEYFIKTNIKIILNSTLHNYYLHLIYSILGILCCIYLHMYTSICKLFEPLRRTYLIYKCLSIICIAKSMGLTQRWHEKGLNDRNTWYTEFIFSMKTILMKKLYTVRFKTVENHDSNSLAVKLDSLSSR